MATVSLLFSMSKGYNVRPEVKKHQMYHMTEVIEKMRNNTKEDCSCSLIKNVIILDLSFRIWKWEWYLSTVHRSDAYLH